MSCLKKNRWSEFQRQHNSRHFDDGLSYGCGERGRLSRTSFEPQSMLRRLQRTTQNRLSCVTFAPRPLRHRVAGATDRAQNRAVMCTGSAILVICPFRHSCRCNLLILLFAKREQVVNLRCVTSVSSLTGSCSTVVHMTSLSHEDSTTCRTHIFLSQCRQSVSHFVQCHSMHKCTFQGLGSK